MAAQGKPKVYGVLLIDGFDLLDIFGPLEYINALPDVTVHLIAESSMEPASSGSLNFPGNLPSKTGERVLPTHTLATAPPLDVLLVLGGLGTRRILKSELKLPVAFIEERYASLQYLMSVCTGAALTAASGVLNGKRATGNKRSWAFVTEQGPLVNWVPKARWVVDSNIWTSSGVEAGTDMIYKFVREVYSEQLADTIAQVIEHEPHTDPSFDPFADLYNTAGTPIPPPPVPAVIPGYPPTYGVIAYPGVSSLELWGTLEFLFSVSFSVPCKVSVIAESMSPITTNLTSSDTEAQVPLGLPNRGQVLLPDYTFDDAPAFDVLIVPGAPRVPSSPRTSAFIAARYPALRHLISVGTGSALVAQSGVLDQAPAATSEYFFKQVADSYPLVSWVPNARWVVLPDGKVWSASAGVAGLDVMNAFISQAMGAGIAELACAIIEYVPITVSGS